MQREYYALCMDSLRSTLDEVEQASAALEDARGQRDQNARRQAQERMERAAERAVNIEAQMSYKLTCTESQGLSCPRHQSAHLSYMWFWSRREYADKKARQASENRRKRQAEKESRLLSEATNALHNAWQKNLSTGEIPNDFCFIPDESAVTLLPLLSFMLRIPFTLHKPYLSRDDTGFYIIDNPVKKEWVFKVPYVAPSQWKGALRSAMIRQLVTELYTTGDEAAFTQKRLQLYRLFGNEKDGTADYLNRMLALQRVGPPPKKANEKQYEEWRKQFEEELHKVEVEFDATLHKQGYRIGDIEGFLGRMYFFPTFFDKIGLEVINPHDRESGSGSQPIYFECVPQGTQGTFTLIYVPFNSTEQDDAKRRQEVAEDLEALARGIHAMLTIYGFGAKTSSGYGVAEEKLAGTGMLVIRAALSGMTVPTFSEPEPTPKRDLPRYLESPTHLHPDFRREDGSLKSEDEYRILLESRGQEYGKKQKQLYEKARKWWEREGKGLHEEGATQPEREPVLQETLLVVKRTFVVLSELQAVAQEVADALRKEEEA